MDLDGADERWGAYLAKCGREIATGAGTAASNLMYP
jgi:hypothetical protein